MKSGGLLPDGRRRSMSTYKLGPGTTLGAVPPSLRRPLICEVCFEALGNVHSVAAHARLSVRVVVGMWPEMKAAVERHETLCLPAGESLVARDPGADTG